jgi:hypothetical protein
MADQLDWSVLQGSCDLCAYQTASNDPPGLCMGKQIREQLSPPTSKVEAHRRTDNNNIIGVALPHPLLLCHFLNAVSIVCTRTALVTPSTPLLVPPGPVRQVQVRRLQSSTTRLRPDHHQTKTTKPKLNLHLPLPTSTTTTPTTAASPSLPPTNHQPLTCQVNSQQLPATSYQPQP